MRKNLILTSLAVLLLFISTNVIAQNKAPKLRIMSLKKGQVRLTRGAVNNVVGQKINRHIFPNAKKPPGQ
jgi:hypothetical protein